MIEQRIQQHFFESGDLLYQAAEQLARPLGLAVQVVVEAIIGGNRILCAGLGLAAWEANYLATRLSGRFEQDRPGLAAWSLSAQLNEAAGVDVARLVQTHGHPGDVLLLIEPQSGQTDAWADALEAAHAQEMSVVALTAAAQEWRSLLRDTDVQVSVAHERDARVLELQRVLLHALLDGVDVLLLGSDE